MLKTLIKKELLDNLLSLRFFITLLLCVLLIPIGIYVGAQAYQSRVENYRQGLALYQDSMQGTLNPQQVEAKGLRPPSPFSIFADGMDRSIPDEFISTRNDGLKMQNSAAQDNPLAVLFGRVDLLFVVGVVMSLLATLFTFDATTREKERGTLRLALANALPRHLILLGKLFGHLLTFLIPFILSMLIALLILAVTGTMAIFDSVNLGRLALILTTALLFISAFFTLGIMVSTLNHRSLTAQITLLFLWVLLIFGVPRISGMLAQIIKPVKTLQTVNLETQLIRKNIEAEKASALGDALMRSIGSSNGEDDYDKLREPIVKALKEKENREILAIQEDYKHKKAAQTRLAANLSRLSPLGSLTFGMTHLAGTGLDDAIRLEQRARQFHNEAERDIHNIGWKDMIPGKGMRMTFGRWITFDEVPRFQHQQRSLAESFQSCWFDITLLILFNLLFFAGAYVAFLRYDVR